MTLSSRAYAKALFEITDGASKSEVSEIVDKFLAELKLRHKLSKVNKIIQEFEVLSDLEAGIVKAKITSSRKLSKETLNEAAKLVKKKTNAQEVVWEEIVDPEVLGGIIIAAKDFIIDMSLANRVADLATWIKE